MLEKNCDILTIGTEFGGLLTAALLGKRGMSVVVLPTLPHNIHAPSVEPHCFSPLNNTTLRSLLGHLDINPDELPQKSLSEISLQIVMPGHRVDLSHSSDYFHEELDREFPSEKQNILDVYQKLSDYRLRVDQERLEENFPPENFWHRFRLKRLIRENELDRKVGDFFPELDKQSALITFFEGQLRHTSDAFTPNPFIYQMAKFIDHSGKAYFAIEGGVDTLKRLLLQRIAEYGGTILDPFPLNDLHFDRRLHLIHAALGESGGTLFPRHVIWNRPIVDLAPYLPKRLRFRPLAKRIARSKPTHYRFCVQFSLPKAYWPVGMHEEVLIIPAPGEALEGTNCLYLQRSNSAQADQYTLSVHYLLREGAQRNPDTEFAERHLFIEEALRSLIPFSDRELKLTFPTSLPDDGAEQTTLFPLVKTPFETFREAAHLHPVYEQETNRFLDLFPLHYKTASRNFFLNAPEVLLYFGLAGQVLLAKKLSRLLRDENTLVREKALRKKKRMI